MEVIEKYKWLIVAGVAVIVLGGLLVINSNQANDADSDDQTTMTEQEKKAEKAKETKEKEEAAKKEKAEKAATGERTYTAQSGDSYAVLARKAVQGYAKDAEVSVSRAQIVAAETFLTTDAGSPLLEVGQQVTFDKGTVAKAVSDAQSLTSAELAAWQTYVPYVIFDTSKNG